VFGTLFSIGDFHHGEHLTSVLILVKSVLIFSTFLHASAIHVQHVYSFGLQGPFLYVSVDHNKVQCTLNALMCTM